MRMAGRLRGSRRAGRRGASAVEFAVVLPVLVTIVLGCVDFGRFAYNYIAVNNAARAGAAYAMMNNYTSTTQSTWQSGVTTAAQQEMTNQMGYSSSNMTVPAPVVTLESSGLRRVQVTASYPFQTIVTWNFAGYGIPHSLTLQKTIVVRAIR
jgi:Flp pilus assembly protein TadG